MLHRGADAVAEDEVGVGYRPHLDGLRAVAVYLVVAFHAGIDRAAGGFLGVDVFFVLSGYLVTQLLLRDVHQRGSIDLPRFYSRRMRRLLPAATIVLLVTMVVFSSVGTPAELASARGDVRSAALYVANWHFIGQSAQYFGADIQASPVVHFWSLSVEEQFYATWPLLLGGLLLVSRRAGHRRWWIVQGAVAVGLLASLAAALWMARTDLNRAYYGTDTRAYQLLAGALVALCPGALRRLRGSSADRPWLPVASAASLAGLVGLATSAVTVGPVTRGAVATALTVALIVSLDARPAGPVHWLLTRPPIVYLGQISYGTYLWHWLVIIVVARVVDAGAPSTLLLTAGLATGLAALSFELLERPVRVARSLDRRRRAVVALGLTTSLVVGMVAVPRVLQPDRAQADVTVAEGTAAGATRVPPDLDWQGAQRDVAAFPECTAEAPERCTLVRGSGQHILVIGDSHARMFIPMLTKLAQDRDLTFSAAVAPVCPWQAGIQYLAKAGVCQGHQADWYPAVVDRLDPDIVVLAHRTFDDPVSTVRIRDEDTGELAPGSAAYSEALRARSASTLDALRSAGRQVVIIEPVPVAPLHTDPLVCLSAATFLDECRFVSHVGPTAVEQVYRDLAAADPGVWSLDLDEAVCPYLPICDPIVDGLIVKRDDTHLTTRYAVSLLTRVERFLDDNGVLR